MPCIINMEVPTVRKIEIRVGHFDHKKELIFPAWG